MGVQFGLITSGKRNGKRLDAHTSLGRVRESVSASASAFPSQ